MINQVQTGLLSALLDAGVEFAVVGGVAVNIHGFVRATHDLDVFIRPTELNAQAAFRALQMVEAPVAGIGWSDLLDDEQHFRYGTDGNFIDILASIGEMPFDQVWVDRVAIEIAGRMVPFISRSNLLINKRQTGRLRDLVDVEELELQPDKDF